MLVDLLQAPITHCCSAFPLTPRTHGAALAQRDVPSPGSFLALQPSPAPPSGTFSLSRFLAATDDSAVVMYKNVLKINSGTDTFWQGVQIRLLQRKAAGRNEAHIIVVLPTVRSLGLRSVHTSFPPPVIPQILHLQALWGAEQGHTRTSAKSTMGPVTSRLPNKPVQPHKAQMEEGQTEVPLSQLQRVSVSTQNLGCSPSTLQQTPSAAGPAVRAAPLGGTARTRPSTFPNSPLLPWHRACCQRGGRDKSGCNGSAFQLPSAPTPLAEGGGSGGSGTGHRSKTDTQIHPGSSWTAQPAPPPSLYPFQSPTAAAVPPGTGKSKVRHTGCPSTSSCEPPATSRAPIIRAQNESRPLSEDGS